MTLEEFTAQLNGSTFWKEFTFSQNQFSPRPGQELELADTRDDPLAFAMFFLRQRHR